MKKQNNNIVYYIARSQKLIFLCCVRAEDCGQGIKQDQVI